MGCVTPHTSLDPQFVSWLRTGHRDEQRQCEIVAQVSAPVPEAYVQLSLSLWVWNDCHQPHFTDQKTGLRGPNQEEIYKIWNSFLHRFTLVWSKNPMLMLSHVESTSKLKEAKKWLYSQAPMRPDSLSGLWALLGSTAMGVETCPSCQYIVKMCNYVIGITKVNVLWWIS